MKEYDNCIVYITDCNYAMPTCISICSVVESYRSLTPLYIYVLCDNVEDAQVRRFESINLKGKEIKIILYHVSSDKYEELTSCMIGYSEQFHVSRTAILKFSLSSIFHNIDRILYIDSDTLVQRGFEDIFLEDISEYYLAAADDMGDYENEEGCSFLASRIQLQGSYFNSGIMFLNLKKMREDEIENKLFEYKKQEKNYFMDQDALNAVVGSKRKHISYQYNFRSALTQIKTFDEINREYFNYKYKTMEECISDQKILHLTDRIKPWDFYMSWFTNIFKRFYLISPYADQPLQLIPIEVYYNRKLKEEEKIRSKMYNDFVGEYAVYNDKYCNAKNWRIPTDIITKGSRVVIYGAGKVGESIMEQNSFYDYFDVALWVDKNYESINDGVFNPKDINSIEFDYILIALASRKDADFVRENLYEDGISWNRIITIYDRKDYIDKAVENQRLLPELSCIQNQTWEDFISRAKMKKVVLFGAGKGASIFFAMRPYDIYPIIMLDNDPNKCGKQVAEYIPEAIPYVLEKKMNAEIYAPTKELIAGFDCNTVIVITLLNDIETVIDQLSDIGFCGTVYSVLTMEVNRRKSGLERRAPIIQYEEDAVRYFEHFELNEKKVLFWTNTGFSDHEKYIALALSKKRNDLDLVFVGDYPKGRSDIPESIRFVKPSNSIQVAYEVETAAIWVFNTDVPEKFRKRNEQIYIQTKHWSSITLKKFFLDIKLYTPESERHKRLVEHGKMINYIITGSDFDTNTCKTGFGYNGEFWQIGSPRSDALWNRKIIKEKLNNKYGLPKDSKILIYSPTYRADTLSSTYEKIYRNEGLDYRWVITLLEKRFGGDWFVFLRLHPAVANAIEYTILPDNVIDVSKEPDGEELVAASDAMLTDYSSIMFEPAYIGLPVFLLAEDLEEYQQQVDFWITYDELPFPIATNKKQLENNIMNFDEDTYMENVNAFFERYRVSEDGHASERAADLICDIIDK